MEPNWEKQKVVSDVQLAQNLIAAGEDVANHYIQGGPIEGFSSTEQVRDAMQYAYIIAALFFPVEYFGGRNPKDIVYLAMHMRFGMDVETFATTILGG